MKYTTGVIYRNSGNNKKTRSSLLENFDEELAQKLLYIDSYESMNEEFGVIPKKIIETKKNDLIGKHKNRIEKKNMKFFLMMKQISWNYGQMI
ncbi:hypothetical protein [Clostridium sp.]|nr:hypothetical protein [Clostridium sp.]